MAVEAFQPQCEMLLMGIRNRLIRCGGGAGQQKNTDNPSQSIERPWATQDFPLTDGDPLHL